MGATLLIGHQRVASLEALWADQIPIKANMVRFTFRVERGIRPAIRVTSWKEHTFTNTATSCLTNTAVVMIISSETKPALGSIHGRRILIRAQIFKDLCSHLAFGGEDVSVVMGIGGALYECEVDIGSHNLFGFASWPNDASPII